MGELALNGIDYQKINSEVERTSNYRLKQSTTGHEIVPIDWKVPLFKYYFLPP